MNSASLAAPLLLLLSAAASGQEISPERTYPLFAIGPTGIFATIEKGLEVTVREVRPDSPAAATALAPGDVLLSAGGLTLAVSDPRVPLGEAITAAEAADGTLRLAVRHAGRSAVATLRLPALGAYAPSWPAGCPKSRAIIAANARYVAACQREDGSYMFDQGRAVRDDLTGCLTGLFLLSSADPTYLPKVKRQVHALAAKVAEHPTTSNWHLGYQGILLAEYYLRTGDRAVLAGLESLCKQAARAQAAGGWGHSGIPGPGYVQSGLMNSAGIPVLTTMILARECGLAVDEPALIRGVKFLYRMAGHGCMPYGDHRSELWWSNTNGRNAMAACAFSLLDEPRFQQAAAHLALLVTDSYYQPEFGHTGGGFNVMWRGIASVHVPARHSSHYRRQMRHLAWYYDLCRRPEGGFSMLPTPPDNTRYCGLAWGSGAVGLTYTAPRAALRICGAPRSRFSARYEPLAFSWGSAADRAFLSTEGAEGFGAETIPPHQVYALLLGEQKNTATVAFCERHLHHYSPLVRTWAARRLAEMNTAPALAALVRAAEHPDPRVRRAAFDAASGYDNWSRPMKRGMASGVVSARFLPAIVKTLADPRAAWWEIDGALFALGHAAPGDIRKQMPRILDLSRHEEWYLRESAFWAIAGLGAAITGEEFQSLADIYARSVHVFARSSYDGGFRAVLRSRPPALDAAARRRALQTLGRTLVAPGIARGYGRAGLHEAAHRAMMIASHFDRALDSTLVQDLARYLDLWEPYYQHSVWLIAGSKWQPGILKILPGLGARGKPIVIALEKILKRYPRFDGKRMSAAARDLPERIRAAVQTWEAAHGKSK